MGLLAMLRQVIGQLQELIENYGSHCVYNNFNTNNHRYFQIQPHNVIINHNNDAINNNINNRCCFLNTDDSSADDYYCLTMAAERSGRSKMLEPSTPPPSKKSRREWNQVKAGDTLPLSEAMEQQIWKEFPEDLIEAVIARLPIDAFFRFRSVCQKWNSLLHSKSFLQLCEEVPQTNPWFYTITYEDLNSGFMYDPSSKKWHHPVVSSMSTKLILLPVASAGGLVCFLDVGHKNFCVCNPLTESFRELPARSVKVWSRVAVGMSLNGKSTNGGYKILWVGCNGEYEVYDSLSNSWTCPGSMPSSIKLPLKLNFRSHAVAIDGILYFMRSDPDGIVSYNTVSGVWTQFVIPAPKYLTDFTLAGCGSRLMLVGLQTKNAATSLCVWELEKMTRLWKEVDRMPNLWCLDFYGKHVRMTCLGNKGLLLLSLRSRQMNRLVMYNIMSREWMKVHSCAVPRGKKRQWIACGTEFYPSLTAKA